MQEDLEEFLKLYERAANSRNFDTVAPFISEEAVFWFTNGTYEGAAAIRRAFEATWASIIDEQYTISNIEWITISEKAAVCVYNFKSDGFVDGARQIYEGRGTNVIVKDGNWKIAHEHLSKPPES